LFVTISRSLKKSAACLFLTKKVLQKATIIKLGTAIVLLTIISKQRSMKKIIIAASIVGAAAAGVYIYLRKRNAANKIEDAADHAEHAAKSHIRKVNHKVKEALA